MHNICQPTGDSYRRPHKLFHLCLIGLEFIFDFFATNDPQLHQGNPEVIFATRCISKSRGSERGVGLVQRKALFLVTPINGETE
jgi:hypothetical protein